MNLIDLRNPLALFILIALILFILRSLRIAQG